MNSFAHTVLFEDRKVLPKALNFAGYLKVSLVSLLVTLMGVTPDPGGKPMAVRDVARLTTDSFLQGEWMEEGYEVCSADIQGRRKVGPRSLRVL